MSKVNLAGIPRGDLLAVGCVLLVALALRLPQAAEPLWVDELHTGWVVTHGLDDVALHAHAGNQSSAWFYLPWLSTRWGESAFWLRLPTFVAGLALLPLLYAVARRWTGSSLAALAAGLLAALDTRFAFYGVEARAYACVQCLAVIHFVCWLHRDQPPPAPEMATTNRLPHLSWSIGWIVAGIMLFYVHYTAALLIAAQAFYDLGAALFERDLRVIGRRAFEYFLVMVGCFPAAAHLRTIADHRDDWAQALTADSLAGILPWYVQIAAPLVILTASTSLRYLQRRRPLLLSPPDTIPLRLLVAVGAPCLLAWGATRGEFAQLMRYRYLIGALTLLPLVTSMILILIPQRLARILFLITLTALALFEHPGLTGLRQQGSWPPERTEQWEALVQRLNAASADKPFPILLCPALVEDRRLRPTDDHPRPPKALVEFCRFPLESLYRIENRSLPIHPLPTLTQPRLTDAVRVQLRESPGAWLVVRGDQELAQYVTRQLSRELRADRRLLNAEQTESFGGVTLVLLAWQTRKPAASSPSKTEGSVSRGR